MKLQEGAGMDRRRFLMTTGAAVLSLSIAGCGSDDEADDEASGDTGGDGDSDDDSNGDQKLEIIEHEFYEEDMSAGVRGTVQNISDGEVDYVGIEVEFLDSEGTRIDDSLANTTDLAADQKWNFDTAYLGSDSEQIDDYSIEVGDSSF